MSDLNLEKIVAEIQTDLRWIKESLISNDTKFARKWVEHVLGIMMLGSVAWVIGQLLLLIPKVKAIL